MTATAGSDREVIRRTETLLTRTPYFNPDAAAIVSKFKLRPIPQTHIERIFRNGQPLTADQRVAEQNPGY